ncbi:hypothetical protein [Methylobacterium nigriterrae]|uniref:hypothetical protein n=1 Tax=Methylobacterium nigriterrae TaxID=3127512 RepID=UPI00301327CF
MSVARVEQHDETIRSMVEGGYPLSHITQYLRAPRSLVRARVAALGLSERSADNGRVYQARVAKAGRCRFRPLTIARRFDERASRLARQLRARAGSITPWHPEHFVYILHEAGLTLHDIEECTGIAPAHAVVAIRRCVEARTA